MLDSNIGISLQAAPAFISIKVGNTTTISARGGQKPYSFSVSNNVGTIGAQSGIYTATIADTATILIKDAAGNSTSAFVTCYNTGKDPSNVVPANLKLWYKADALSLSDGQAVTSWPSSSSWPNAMTGNATYRVNLYGGKPAVRFNGTSDTLNGINWPIVTNITLFLVASVSSTTGGYVVYGDGTSNVPAIFTNVNNRAYEWAPASNQDDRFTFKPQSAASGLNLLEVVRSGTSSLKGFYNGSVAYDTTPAAAILNNFQGMSLATNRYGGDVTEFIVYDTALSDSDRQAVECYLLLKYGMANSLCQ